MNFKTMRNNQTGFTLMELLIVVLVISTLSAVLVSVIDPGKSQGRARDGVRLSNVKDISGAIESYRQTEGVYPASGDHQNPASLLRTVYMKNWPAPFSDKGVTDAANWSYEYAPTGATLKSSFLLFSPNSRGNCYKYQTDWHQVMECPTAECSTLVVSLASACSDL